MTSLVDLATVALSRGDLPAAEDFYRRGLAAQEAIDADGQIVANILNGLGSVAHAQGDDAASGKHLRRALAIEEKHNPGGTGAALVLNNLAELALGREDFNEAVQFLRRALAIHEKLVPSGLEIASTIYNLGLVAKARGDFAEAESQFRRGLTIRERLSPGSWGEAEFRHELGLTLRLRGNAEASAGALCQAVESLEKQRGRVGSSQTTQSSFAGKYGGYYHDCAAALNAVNRPADAFQMIERSRARSLLAMVAERDLLFTPDIAPELDRERRSAAAEYDRTQAALGQLNPATDGPQIERLTTRLRTIRSKQDESAGKIRQTSPRFASLQYPAPLDLEGARRVLDPGTTLIAYSVGKDETLQFVVKPAAEGADGFKVFKLPVTEKALREKVQAFRVAVQRSAPDARGALKVPQAPNAAPLTSQATELYDLLLGSVESSIASSTRVFLSVDGPLHTLPFAALMRKDGEYLVEWKPLHTVSSATVYAELRRSRRARAPSSSRVVAFGDPAYPAADATKADGLERSPLRSAARSGFAFAPLPSSRKEVEGIAGLFKGRSQAFVGADATEEQAKAVGKDVPYLHFATHGYVNERSPLDSALVLAIPEKLEDGRDNGLLQAWEVFETMRIDADLVTLSACETGLGKEFGGEGLVGLTRAFQYAGARSVLASLWSVSDESTSSLMTAFYKALRSGQTKDQALRTAQLTLIRTAPFHWAAFQIFGDWK